MKQPLFAFTADWHIAKSAWKNSGIDGDSHFGLKQVIEYCIEHKLELVAAGDLFDTTDPHPDDVRAVRELMARMQAAELHVAFIQGQHERESVPWLEAITRWPFHINRNWYGVEELDPPADALRLYGLDWRPASQLAEMFASIDPVCNALVAHQVWSPLMGGLVTCEAKVTDTPSHIRLLLTGDLHKHVRLDVTRDDGSPLTVLSPGSLCMQSIDEEPDKQFYVIGRDEDGDIAVESVPLRSRAFYHFKVESEADIDAANTHVFSSIDGDVWCAQRAGEIPDHLTKPLVRVDVADGVDGAKARLKAAAKGRYHLFVVQGARSATGNVLPERAKALATLRERGVLGVLAEYPILNTDDPEAVRRVVAALLTGKDPVAVIDELCRQAELHVT